MSLFWLLLLPALFAVAVYLPAASFDFISLDDNLYILDNQKIRLGLSAEGIRWAFTTLYTTNWHPLTWLSLLAEYQMFGVNPAGYHVVGIVLHALNSSLLFTAMQALTRDRWKSVAVAVFFAVHPLNIESVVWIAERKNLLSTLFFLLTLWSYARFARKTGMSRYLWPLLLFTLGLMTKPMAVTLPLLLLLLDYWPLRRFSLVQNGSAKGMRGAQPLLVEKIPFLAISLFSVLITIYAARTGGAAKSLLSYPLLTRLENAMLSYASYLKMAAWPVDLAIYYPYPRHIPAMGAIAAFLFLTVVTIAVVLNGRRYRQLVTGWFWYLITLLPVIGIMQVGRQAMANRYAYIPLIGIFIALVWTCGAILRRLPGCRVGAFYPVIIAALFWGVLLSFELGHWKDSEAAYSHALFVTKDNHIALVGIGNTMLGKGKPEAAEKYYRESLRLMPDYEITHYNMGLALMRQGKMKESESYFRNAITFDHGFAKAYNYLGYVLAKQDRRREAKRCFETAIERDPDDQLPRENLSLLLSGSL